MAKALRFYILTFLFSLGTSHGQEHAGAAEIIQSDICIYGGTVAGVAAAVQASRMGKTAVIAEFGNHLGGMSSGGLGATDIGNKAAIGGIAREFYHNVALHYAKDDAWRFEQREDYFKH